MNLDSSVSLNQTNYSSNILSKAKAASRFGSILSSCAKAVQKIGANIEILSSSKQATATANFFKNNEAQFNSVKYLKTLSFIRTVPGLYSSIKVFPSKQKDQKVWSALKAISYALSISSTIEDIVSVSTKVSATVIRAFGGLGLVASAIDLAADARRWWNTRSLLNNFKVTVGYNKNGKYTFGDYKKLCKFINTVGTKTLAKQLNVSQESFEDSIHLKIREIENDFTPAQERKIKELMDLIKGQLKVRKQDFSAAMITDAINVIGGALVVASIAQPYLIAIWVVLTLSIAATQYAVKTIRTYQFEDGMGMIDREDKAAQKGVKDFCKWFFKLNRHPKPLSKEVIDFSNRLKQGL